jgi:hypothetical protein
LSWALVLVRGCFVWYFIHSFLESIPGALAGLSSISAPYPRPCFYIGPWSTSLIDECCRCREKMMI